MKYPASKPNRTTVWCMFALGIMIGIGSAYVAIDPDGLIDLFIQRMTNNTLICTSRPSNALESVESITENAQDLFKTLP